MTTDGLLIVGLFGVYVELLVAIGVYRWSCDRPHRLMCWAVKERARMTWIESVVWLATRRVKRAFETLAVVLNDELSPALVRTRSVVEELTEELDE